MSGKVWKGTPEFIWESVSNLVPMDKAGIRCVLFWM